MSIVHIFRCNRSKLWITIILLVGGFVYFSIDAIDGRKTTQTQDYDISSTQKKLLKSEMEFRSSLPGANEDRVIMNRTTFWDHFPATFPCPRCVERVGRFGDGGKNVCGFSEIKKLTKCVVYSFGIKNEVTFEKMILEQTNCTIRMYDVIKILPNPSALIKQFGDRITYSDAGIGESPNNTLKAIMTKNGDFFIDILKVDIEGREWSSLSRAIKDFPDGLPIGQLLVEIHFFKPDFDPNEEYELFKNWLYQLENSGLRPYFREPNETGPENFWEYSFLSVRFGIFKIE